VRKNYRNMKYRMARHTGENDIKLELTGIGCDA
jgi:hypothetical protein